MERANDIHGLHSHFGRCSYYKIKRVNMLRILSDITHSFYVHDKQYAHTSEIEAIKLKTNSVEATLSFTTFFTFIDNKK